MPHLAEQGLLLLEQFFGVLEQPLLLHLGNAAFSNVLDREQDHPAGDAFVANGKGVELDRAPAVTGEVRLELEALEPRVLRGHGHEQLAQSGNVPLAAGQVEQQATAGRGRILAENFIEAAAAGEQMERVVEHQEGLGQRVDDRQRKPLRLREIVKLGHERYSIRRELRTTLSHRRAWRWPMMSHLTLVQLKILTQGKLHTCRFVPAYSPTHPAMAKRAATALKPNASTRS